MPSLGPIRFSLLYLTKAEFHPKPQFWKFSICFMNNCLPPRSSPLAFPLSKHFCLVVVPFDVFELRHTLKHVLELCPQWLWFCWNHKGQISQGIQKCIPSSADAGHPSVSSITPHSISSKSPVCLQSQPQLLSRNYFHCRNMMQWCRQQMPPLMCYCKLFSHHCYYYKN